MTIAQETTASPSYDPENLGTWTGQLPNPDLVDQLPPPIERKPGGPMDRDEWRRSNAARVGHATYKLLDVLSGYSNPEGLCWPGIDSLIKVSGMSERVIYRGFLELRVKSIAWLTYPGKPVCKSNPYQLAGGLDGWATVRNDNDRLSEMTTTDCQKWQSEPSSSSNPKINPESLPGLVDAKRVADPKPEPETRTGLKSFSLEEERTGTGTEEVQAWVDSHVSETPAESQARRYLDHTWAVWEYPAHPYGWKHGKEAAIKHVMASPAKWTKFRKDLVVHLAKVGLPKPLPPDPENDRARESAAAWMDQRLEEAPKRMVDMKCAGCKRKRQLPPGETRCQPCRKLSEDPKIVSQPDSGPGFADDYEKLLEETIRRYHQEEHGPAPEDAKVEAVGAALDAG